jgi:hypothetical protein
MAGRSRAAFTRSTATISNTVERVSVYASLAFLIASAMPKSNRSQQPLSVSQGPRSWRQTGDGELSHPLQVDRALSFRLRRF